MKQLNIKRHIKKAIAVFYFTIFCSIAALNGFCNDSMGQDNRIKDAKLFTTLVKRLSADGFDKTYLTSLYEQENVRFDTDTVSRFFVHSESRLDYDQFSLPHNILSASQYMQTHGEKLLAAEEIFDVDREVITAIILVETRLGAYTGTASILDTLSTMASLTEQSLRDFLWEQIPPARRFQRSEYESKAQRKSDWAYTELKAFLRYTIQESIAPAEVKGSYAGAMGISQFMPSNIPKLAKDGNNDGRINLFDHADAIMSVANYLHYHGWRKQMNKDDAFKVILRYNNSKYYANAILKVADLLKGPS